jgi:hypothetical protein
MLSCLAINLKPFDGSNAVVIRTVKASDFAFVRAIRPGTTVDMLSVVLQSFSRMDLSFGMMEE